MSSVTPAPEIIEVELEGFLCESPTGGGSEGFDEDDIEEGFGS